MTTLQKLARLVCAFTFVFGGGVGRSDDAKNINVAPAANRWAIFIDASRDSNDQNDALLKFRNALIESGIPEENALIYSNSSENLDKRPTRETLKKITDALQRPDEQVVWPGETKTRRLRENDGVCEIQVYLTGLGVANERNETFFAPADVEELQIKSVDDPNLIPLRELEDALLFTKNLQKPIERVFFIVALNSPRASLRERSEENVDRLKDVDLNSMPFRGKGKDADASKYAYFRIATKNARFDDKMVGSFYLTLLDGLAGSADLAGDQNGAINAAELASYLETNARLANKTVVAVHSGNDDYPLCKSRMELSIPDGIFGKIAKTFDNPKYAKERRFALLQAQIQNQNKKKDAENTTKGTEAK